MSNLKEKTMGFIADHGDSVVALATGAICAVGCLIGMRYGFNQGFKAGAQGGVLATLAIAGEKYPSLNLGADVLKTMGTTKK